MANPLEMLVKSAAGTGAPTNPTSRYYGFAVSTLSRADGKKIAYLQRRMVPQPEIYASVTNYIVVDGDRIDNVAAKYLGDPLLYWMICEANGASDPDALMSQVGRRIKIPLAASMATGARNG
jgi:nucleoid-associated protein YgaU